MCNTVQQTGLNKTGLKNTCFVVTCIVFFNSTKNSDLGHSRWRNLLHFPIASADFCHCLVPVDERSNVALLSLTVSLSQVKFQQNFWRELLRATLIATFLELILLMEINLNFLQS